jgi:molybdopterin converting factor small subunit
VAGIWPAKLKVVNSGRTIATGRIRFVIDADTVAAGAVPSDSELEGLVAEAAAYAEAAKDGAYYGSPLKAATVAEMTDKNRVYVYTGSESGYTNGNWYYWDGSTWASGGVYNSVAVDTDKTLNVSGKAADAKVTGDAIRANAAGVAKNTDDINELKADLEQLEPGLSAEAKAALLTCFRHIAFLDEDADYYGDLESALYSGDVVSINATFAQNQNVFSSTDKLSDLIPFLTVTATYGDGTQNTINDYTLSGSLTDGTSVITVSYKAKTTTFPVNVTTVPSGYTMKNYVDSDGIPYMVTQIPETAAVNWWYRLKEMRTGYENRNGHVFSSGNAYTPYLFALGQAANSRINAKRFGNEVTSSGTYLLDIWETNIVYEIESFKDNNSIYLNGEEVASVPIGVTMSSNNTFSLLGYRGPDGVTAERFRFIGRFYYLKIFDNNNRKAHDFVPCINSSNVVGIYDLVDGIFYAPATGTLTAG